jgi:hypothetical protein
VAQSICSVSECGKPVRARGLCSRHYQNLQIHGFAVLPKVKCLNCPEVFEPRRADHVYHSEECKQRAHAKRQREAGKPSCSVDKCSRQALAPKMKTPLCSMHYRRLQRTGELGGAESTVGGRMGIIPCEVEGCNETYYSKGLCSLHYNRRGRTGDVGAVGRTKKPDGSISYTKNKGYQCWYWSVAGRRVRIGEHTIVMEWELGRQLYPFEEVHHKNGIRDDNDLSNLELWVVSQPRGQRVDDLVQWVVESYPDLTRRLLEGAI